MDLQRKNVQQRGLLNARNVGKASELALTSLSTREFTQKRNHINVNNVIRGLGGAQILITLNNTPGIKPYKCSWCGERLQSKDKSPHTPKNSHWREALYLS